MSTTNKSGPPTGTRITAPSTELRRKVPMVVMDSTELANKAEAIVNALVSTYPGWASADIAKLKAVIADMKADPKATAEVQLARAKDIDFISHDMKGQGGTFGYQLVTYTCDLLCEYIRQLSFVGTNEIKMIENHIAWLDVALERNPPLPSPASENNDRYAVIHGFSEAPQPELAGEIRAQYVRILRLQAPPDEASHFIARAPSLVEVLRDAPGYLYLLVIKEADNLFTTMTYFDSLENAENFAPLGLAIIRQFEQRKIKVLDRQMLPIVFSDTGGEI